MHSGLEFLRTFSGAMKFKKLNIALVGLLAMIASLCLGFSNAQATITVGNCGEDSNVAAGVGTQLPIALTSGKTFLNHFYKVDSHGRIVEGGTLIHQVTGRTTSFIARFNPDKSIDATFGNGGYIEHQISERDRYAVYRGCDLAIGTNDIIFFASVASGYTPPYSNFDPGAFLVLQLFDANGNLVTDWTHAGEFGMPFIFRPQPVVAGSSARKQEFVKVTAMSVDSENNLVLAGLAAFNQNDTDRYLWIARLSSDIHFDANGIYGITDLYSTPNSQSIFAATKDYSAGYLDSQGVFEMPSADFSINQISFDSLNGFSATGATWLGGPRGIQAISDGQVKQVLNMPFVNQNYQLLPPDDPNPPMFHVESVVPTPPPFQYPVQKSLIASISSAETKSIFAGVEAPIVIKGNFKEQILNIGVNGKMLKAGAWKQTDDSLEFVAPPSNVGKLTIYIYNGSVPVLFNDEIVVVQRPLSPEEIALKAKPVRTLIKCLGTGHHFKHVFAVNPVCPAGYTLAAN